ncbi:MAG: hypothetical protein ACJ8EG_08050 [Sphingomicrobium sp.]
MSEQAEFKLSRASNALTGLGLLFLTACILFVTLFVSESEFLGTRIRRGGGLVKLVEQTIGWELFVCLMIAFGLWVAVYAIVLLWKVIDARADVTAHTDRLEFHPAVRRSSASYDEDSHWLVEFVSGHPVLWIHFHEPYWSLQGLFKRKTVKLEGGREDLEPLFEYFAHHPIMMEKYVR